ncbi:type II secretion system F family protein [Oleiharenicola lentus]|uniref:Type II secretion system F family protein n=1 Tax=Oleiharenicola lentus TaxID=2508720 RepID=A0A4Q1C8B7_9BACT|nr:type II secretion system F family protein [Oleiharenicola lentus]RXK55086.1 type II secretion system F family protein [Oleiharenicola lentus]
MPTYRYSARDAGGQVVESSLDAPSRRDALRVLASRGLQPVRLDESGSAKPAKSAASLIGEVLEKPAFNKSLLLPFLQALHELTASGLSAGEAVRLLSLRLKEPKLRALSATIWTSLSEGRTLSAAMEVIPAVFNRQTVSLVRAAEATGNLTEVIQRLIDHFTQQKEMRQRLTTALVYPVFVCFLAFGVILFFVFFLLPRLQGLLASLGGKLPLSTQIVVAGAQFMVRYGVFLLPVVLLGAIALWRWRLSESGRRVSDAWLVKIAFVRSFVMETTLLNFTQILAVLLENGIPTVEALRLTERTVANRTLQAELHKATDRVLEGASLSAALGQTGFFPDLLLDRLAVGESTGKLAPCLRDISKNYAARHTRRLQALTSVISTAVLLFAFTFVGLIAYAIVSAVLEVSASFKF